MALVKQILRCVKLLIRKRIGSSKVLSLLPLRILRPEQWWKQLAHASQTSILKDCPVKGNQVLCCGGVRPTQTPPPAPRLNFDCLWLIILFWIPDTMVEMSISMSLKFFVKKGLWLHSTWMERSGVSMSNHCLVLLLILRFILHFFNHMTG